MGETAENVAREWKISREDQDRFAFESQLKIQTGAPGGQMAGRDHSRGDHAQ